MSGAMEIAAVGLRAQQRALETIAGNVSNINTPAFKRSSLRFAELVAAPSPDENGRAQGAAFSSIAGVGQWAQPMVNLQGAIEATGNGFDFAIDGKGFVELMGPAGQTLLWRGGSLKIQDDGLLATTTGLSLKAGISVPTDAASIRIDREGTVYAVFGGDREESELGKISLVKLDDAVLVERLDGGIYAVDEAAEVLEAPAGEEGLGYFVQGSLERSNVDLNQEMVGLLIAQRAYSANAQVVRAVDEFLSLANGLRR